MKFIAVRSYRKGYIDKTEKLNSYLQRGWEVVTVTPFMKDGVTEYIEYILKEPNKETSKSNLKVKDLRKVIRAEDIYIEIDGHHKDIFERNIHRGDNEYLQLGNYSISLWNKYGDREIKEINSYEDRLYIEII